MNKELQKFFLILSGIHPTTNVGCTHLTHVDSYDVIKLAQEVDKICRYFLYPRKISYFQFKRTYRNGTFIILANVPKFFKEFLRHGFIEPTIHLPIYTRQRSYCFWDETLSSDQRLLLQEKQGICHGLTILSRRKDFYDCASFAMSTPHPSPVAYYFYIMKDLQDFSELFPVKASHLIKEMAKKPLKPQMRMQDLSRKYFFLPKRSARFNIVGENNNYITTYEALCVQLLQEGKSYKEIGTLLSMSSTTVKTHLIRLKARTGLSFQEASLQSFQDYKGNNVLKIKHHKKQKSRRLKESTKHKST